MNIGEFSTKVCAAASQLRCDCPTGKPSENQIRESARRLKLPMKDEQESFLLDPIRIAIVINAYRIGGTGNMTLAMDNAWKHFQTLPVAA